MELTVQTTMPAFIGNFDELKAQLTEGIKKYDIEVTEENVPEAKKMATDLNKLSTVINKVKIEKVKEVSAPIDVFKAQVADLCDICQQGREKILKQVAVFEDKTRARCKELIDAELAAAFDAAAIRPEFRTCDTTEMVTLSGISKTGKLTKGAKDSVAAKVAQIKALQDRVDMRLLQLENASLKAGLKSALRKEHVEPFLMLPDVEYEAKLFSIIGIEVQRQSETESRVRDDLTKRPLRFFRCQSCGNVATDYDQPAKCPKCTGAVMTEHQTLAGAQQAAPAIASVPLQPPPPPAPLPIVPTATPKPAEPVWNQERLHQFRQGVGDQVFFQMFKIVYFPISERAFSEAIANNPDLNIKAALDWAKGTE